MIARVRGVIAASSFCASIWNVSGIRIDEDRKGVLPSTALTVAINVYGGTITSSPGSIPMALRLVISALVPLAVARHVLAPVNCA